MSDWIAFGLRRGILTTRYPRGPAEMADGYRGHARVEERASREEVERGAAACLSGAIATGEHPVVRMQRCFQCGECRRVSPEAFTITNDYELALVPDDVEAARARLEARARTFGRSVHVRHIDAGSDGSCEQEIIALFNPFYDLNRLGIFLTATPRHADVLLVTGVVTKALAEPLRMTFAAMPEPRTVVAVGTAACSGSIFAGSDAVVGPVDAVVPVDVKVPGAPPAPLTILHALWVALGRERAHAREVAS